MAKYALTCPHCATTDQYDLSLGPSSNGDVSRQCTSCRKSFRVGFASGQIKSVKKS